MAVNRDDLDSLALQGCSIEGCDHKGQEKPFFLHARCHIKARLEVSYLYNTGVLVLQCGVCRKTVAEVAVAH
jgi:hypothetical protein